MSTEMLLYGTPAEKAISFGVSLIWTLILYGTGPMILAAKRKKPITDKGLTKFCAIYTFVAWFSFNMFNSVVLGEKVSTGAAAILWGTIFNFIAEARLKRRGLYYNRKSDIPIPSQTDDPQEPGVPPAAETSCCQQEKSEEKHTYGPLDPPEKKTQRRTGTVLAVIGVLLCLVVAASGWFVAYQRNQQINQLKSEVKELEQDLLTSNAFKNSYKKQYNDLKKWLDESNAEEILAKYGVKRSMSFAEWSQKNKASSEDIMQRLQEMRDDSGQNIKIGDIIESIGESADAQKEYFNSTYADRGDATSRKFNITKRNP